MKAAIFALLVIGSGGIRLSADPAGNPVPSPNLPTYPLPAFPTGSVNNMNYEVKYDAPPEPEDLRKCQEKVGLHGELNERTLRNCPKDIHGHRINPGKV